MIHAVINSTTERSIRLKRLYSLWERKTRMISFWISTFRYTIFFSFVFFTRPLPFWNYLSFVLIFYSIFCSNFFEIFPKEPFLCIGFGQILTIFPSIPSIFFFTDSCSVISFLNFDFFFRCSHIQIFDTIRCYKMNERCSLSRDNIEIHVLCG